MTAFSRCVGTHSYRDTGLVVFAVEAGDGKMELQKPRRFLPHCRRRTFVAQNVRGWAEGRGCSEKPGRSPFSGRGSGHQGAALMAASKTRRHHLSLVTTSPSTFWKHLHPRQTA